MSARRPRINILDKLRERNNPRLFMTSQQTLRDHQQFMGSVKNVTAQSLDEIAGEIGDARIGVAQVRADGGVAIIRLNRVVIIGTTVTPTIVLPRDCLLGSNILEIVLTGELFQATGSSQTITPKFYIGKEGSETLVTSDTALSIPTMTSRRTFFYTIRVSSAPAGGTKVRVNEKFDVETATAGAIATIMRTTRTTVIDIAQLGEIDSCFFRISNGATATMFRFYPDTVSVRVLDAVQADEIHWYSQPVGSDGIDTYLMVNNPTTNYGTATVIAIGSSTPATYRSLIKFSELGNFLTDPDLIGFQISEAYLYLTIQTDGSSNARTVELFKVLVPWDELQATWNNRLTGTAWGTAGLGAGTDYSSTVLASASFSSSEAPGIVKALAFNAAGIAHLQSIIDGTISDNGILIKSQTESLDAYLLHSSNSATPELVPVLYLIGSKPN